MSRMTERLEKELQNEGRLRPSLEQLDARRDDEDAPTDSTELTPTYPPGYHL